MLLLLSLLPWACKPVEPAPADLDGLMHWFWDKHAQGTDEDLLEGVDNAFGLVDLDLLAEGPVDGSLSPLSADEAALVGVTDRDPADAVGLYLLNRFSCDLDSLRPILSAADQDQLYAGVYDEYERTYRDSLDDFDAGRSQTLSWDVRYVASYLGSSYEARIEGGLRRVPAADPGLAPHGELLVAHVSMPQPAVFEGDNKSFSQDYQVELFVDSGAGDLLHIYGMWRQADYGSGFSTDDEGVQRLLLNNMASWDDNTAELCVGG